MRKLGLLKGILRDNEEREGKDRWYKVVVFLINLTLKRGVLFETC